MNEKKIVTFKPGSVLRATADWGQASVSAGNFLEVIGYDDDGNLRVRNFAKPGSRVVSIPKGNCELISAACDSIVGAARYVGY